MRHIVCVLIIAVSLTGCDGTSITGVDRAERTGRPHLPTEATMSPMCTALFRVGGTHDPASENYDPSVVDTALMHAPHTFVWEAVGQCDSLLHRYSVNDGPFSGWSPDATATVAGLPDGANEFVAQPGCPGADGLTSDFSFVVNFDPDSRIIEPSEPSGTQTIPNGDTLWVRVEAHDREYLEGVGGGIAEIVIEFDGQVLSFEPPEPAEWWWHPNADHWGDHYIESRNSPQGGNSPHLLTAYAKDVDGRWEPLSSAANLVFWYNHAPTVTITHPAEGDTVGTDFTVTWEGEDEDGDVNLYQYVLDPWENAYATTEEEAKTYSAIDPGIHEFRLRARDDAECWSWTWDTVTFYVE